MNLLHLQYFYVVAKEGGFTRASQALGIRQPAISRMVGQLEGAFGFRLLERQGRTVRLTQRGHQVFERARTIFGEVEALQLSLGQISGECAGDLKFAAAEPIASFLVPLAVRDVRARHPKVYPQFVTGPASYALNGIRSGVFEFGLFLHVPDLPVGIVSVRRFSVPFFLVAKATERKNPRVLDSFIGSREIDDTTTRHFPTLDRWRKSRPDVDIRISTNNLSAHKALVMEGQGVAVLPGFMVHEELESGTFVDLMPAAKLVFEVEVLARETATSSINAKVFLEAFAAVIATSSTPRPTRPRRRSDSSAS
jgi:DNA-binding transcriptional LysR family regulator